VPKIKDKHNPANWMLEVTSMGAEQRLDIDFAQIYKESTLFFGKTMNLLRSYVPQLQMPRTFIFQLAMLIVHGNNLQPAYGNSFGRIGEVLVTI
jgi:hypothetical protein